MTTSRRALYWSLSALFASSAAAQTQELKVTVDGGQFARGAHIAVNVGLIPLKGNLPRKLPSGYSNATAFYIACTAMDEKSTWSTGLGAEVFCSLKDQQTKIGQSPAESVDDIAKGAARHTFAEKLALPENPVGTKLWIIVRLDYGMPGLPPGEHKSLYGSTTLIYRCDQQGSGKTGLVSCAYYTPGGYAIHREGGKVPGPIAPKPPNG